jgi:hypothetical protein
MDSTTKHWACRPVDLKTCLCPIVGAFLRGFSYSGMTKNVCSSMVFISQYLLTVALSDWHSIYSCILSIFAIICFHFVACSVILSFKLQLFNFSVFFAQKSHSEHSIIKSCLSIHPHVSSLKLVSTRF